MKEHARLVSLLLLSRPMGIDLDEGLPHFHSMLQACMALAQAAGLPTRYRFKAYQDLPIAGRIWSNDLYHDNLVYLENRQHLTKLAQDLTIAERYVDIAKLVLDAKGLHPSGAETLEWMHQLALAAHQLEPGQTAQQAARRIWAEYPGNAQFIIPALQHLHLLE